MRPTVFLPAFLLVVGFVTIAAEPLKRTRTVFKTPTGTKYHRQECQHCRQGDKFVGKAIDVDEARRSGLTPCKDCNPPKSDAPLPKIIVRVVGVTDGDTITVLIDKTEKKVRLEGIDAPESKQAFGSRAKQALSKKVFGKKLTLAIAGKDRYGRLLGHIYICNRWINLEMVQEGFAWHFKKYSTDKHLARAEVSARNAGRGLWADKKPIAPWEFRQNR